MQQVKSSRTEAPIAVPQVPDRLWAKLRVIIEQNDPPVRNSGRRRIDSRAALNAILYWTVSGCGWNRLPNTFPDDSSVYRTYQRWRRLGILDQIWALIVDEYQQQQQRLSRTG